MRKTYNVNEARRIFVDGNKYHLSDLKGYYNIVEAVFDGTKQIETKSILIAELKNEMYKLEERKQQIIKLRFFDEYSLEETRRVLGISRERVRQLEERALIIIKKSVNNFVLDLKIESLEKEIEERIRWLVAERDWLKALKTRSTFKCDIPVELLTQDARINNAMEKAGIKTIGDIIYFTEDDFFNIKGICKIGVSKIANALQERFPGWKLKKNEKRNNSTKIKVYDVDDIDERFFDVSIEKLGLSVRAYNCLMRSGIFTLYKLFETSYEDLISIKGFGQKTLLEIDAKKQFVLLASKNILEQQLLHIEADELNRLSQAGISNLGELVFCDERVNEIVGSHEELSKIILDIKQRLMCEYL